MARRASKAQAERAPLRDALRDSEPYRRGTALMEEARSLITDMTGYYLPRLPVLELREESPHALAECGDGVVTVFGERNLTAENLRHETYHFFQDEWRLGMFGTCGREFRRQFAPRSNLPEAARALLFWERAFGARMEGSAHRYVAASLLWNGANEAGARIFEHYPANSDFPEDTKAACVLREVGLRMGLVFRADAEEGVRLIFEPLSAAPDYLTDYSVRKEHQVTLAVAAIALEGSGYDAREAVSRLRGQPGRLLGEIEDMGREDALRSVRRSDRLLDPAGYASRDRARRKQR
jgi:hypothetical protein